MTISFIGSEIQHVRDGVQLHGLIQYSSGPGERYVFQYPSSVADQVTANGDPWLILLLPLAVTLNQTLRISMPIDEVLYANAHKIMQVWASWDPGNVPVPIEAETIISSTEGHELTGQFFTGGIDSFFTAVNYEQVSDHEINEFIFIHGFDIPLENQRAWRTAAENVQRCSDLMHKSCLLMGTNLRETRWGSTRWTELSHGAALIGTAMLLGARYRRLIVPASWNDFELRPWGSHPTTDELFSSSHTKIIHHGSQWTRVERSRMLIESPHQDLALQRLRVCSTDVNGGNCGHCPKCLRTMVTLDLLGVLDLANTFPGRSQFMARLSRLYIDGSENELMAQIRAFAQLQGREDVISAVDAAISRTNKLNRVFKLVEIRALGFWIRDSFPVMWSSLLPIRRFIKTIMAFITDTGGRQAAADETYRNQD